MDYFTPGLRELARKLSRQTARRRLAALQRHLAKAEAELGLLGWQQADYDPETQRQVQEIHNVEREQSRLTNDAASLANEIRHLQTERASLQRSYDESRKQLDTERRRVREPYETIERQLAEKRKIEPNFVRRIPDLDRELREAQKMYSELLTRTPQTPQIRQELVRLRERTVAIPNEKSDLRTQHLRTVSEIRALEEGLETQKPFVDSIEERIRILDADWGAQETVLSGAIKTKEEEKAKIEILADALESAKANPYQQIGQVLADNNIAPVNQPQALDKVKRLRFDVGEVKQIILESEAGTAKENPQVLKISFILWVLIVCGLLAIAIAALH